MKYSLKKILPAFFLLAGLAGCIKEDRSECNPGVLLKYDYSLNTEHTNLFGAEVGKVTAYVFDSDGLYYGCFAEEGNHLTNNYRMHLPLPAGDYSVVVWGGALGTYLTGETNAEGTAFQSELKKGITHIDNFMLLAEKNGQPLQALDPLWHGSVQATSVYWSKDPVAVSLMKNTKQLTVKVKDAAIAAGRSGGETSYRVRCEGNNARFMADNRFGKNAAAVVYQPHHTELAPGILTARLDLLRLVEGNPLRLIVENSEGQTIFNKNIVEELMRAGRFETQEELDREDELEVVIERNSNITITVTINGWNVVDVIPDL